jgi:hypothetical protein
MALLFGWLGRIASAVLDLVIGVAFAAVIAMLFRLANQA